MADESIEALERAWHDLFHRILRAGREEGERAAFDRVLHLIQTAAAESGTAVATETAPQATVRRAEAREEASGPTAVRPAPGVSEPARSPSQADARQSVVPLRTLREWDPPESPGLDQPG